MIPGLQRWLQSGQKDDSGLLCSLFKPSADVFGAPKTNGTDCHCVSMYEIEDRNAHF